ncbi:MAG TPA: succinate dehydrogenase, cytochrome b556 subunit [Casimicrobiaceae bacterium]|nr:succinate dehydrogenase, cytochrome b556 subunit [Casimicrobiaceae bacterium]
MATPSSISSAILRNDARARAHPAFWAFVVHRVSGIVLALFLPLHFFTLSQALTRPAALDRFLEWTRQPAVKLVETLLVLALAAHLAGGVRLLFIEFVGWRADWQKTTIALAGAAAVAYALLFALTG